MTNKEKSNSAKGRESFDAVAGNSLVNFFNRNVATYPTEVGSPKFDLVPVTQQKDLMLNVARLHAQQEYDRIMQLVSVLQSQAADIKRRLEVTDLVHQAEYKFQLYPGQTYWLVFDTKINKSRLSHQGPDDWATGAPDHYEYITKVQWLGDYTWKEVE